MNPELTNVSIAAVILVLLLSLRVSYSIGYTACRRFMTTNINKLMESERNKLLVNGEKIGYSKGYEAGMADARFELKNQFVLFLKEQIKVLEGESPMKIAKPEPPKSVECIRGTPDKAPFRFGKNKL